jgi:trk system potassium uptake protein TrkH
MVLVYGFAAVIMFGTLLLMLPASSRSGEFTSLIDALFTATSAAAVTGHTVVETYAYWSFFGQVVIAVLIFIGGLGFMTAAAFLLMIVGQRIGLQSQLVLRAGIGETELGAVASLVRRIVLFSVLTQAVGAVLFFLQWYVFGELWAGISFLEAVWQSVFHAVSAFNNAGFDILPDSLAGGNSLEGFQADIPLLLVFAALIMLGGFSYPVLADVFSQRKFGRMRLDSKLVVAGTAGLLLVGGTVFLTTEWNNEATIGSQSVAVKLTNAFFQPVTTRTSGFAAVNYNAINGANMVSTETLMFIGGASASTAGGIKVNTFMVVLFAAAAILRGKARVNAFGREIPAINVQRAMVVGAISTTLLLLLFWLLVAVQPELDFRRALFETISAFGTVGLSTGITGDLNDAARLVTSAAMFIGRFGPLTLALLMAGRETTDPYRFAEERVRIG